MCEGSINWLLDSTQLQKQSMKSVYCKNDDTQHELFTSYDVHDLKHFFAIQQNAHNLATVTPVITVLIVLL